MAKIKKTPVIHFWDDNYWYSHSQEAYKLPDQSYLTQFANGTLRSPEFKEGYEYQWDIVNSKWKEIKQIGIGTQYIHEGQLGIISGKGEQLPKGAIKLTEENRSFYFKDSNGMYVIKDLDFYVKQKEAEIKSQADHFLSEGTFYSNLLEETISCGFESRMILSEHIALGTEELEFYINSSDSVTLDNEQVLELHKEMVFAVMENKEKKRLLINTTIPAIVSNKNDSQSEKIKKIQALSL